MLCPQVIDLMKLRRVADTVIGDEASGNQKSWPKLYWALLTLDLDQRFGFESYLSQEFSLVNGRVHLTFHLT